VTGQGEAPGSSEATRDPHAPATGQAVRLALVVALVGLVQTGAPPGWAVLALFAVVVTLVASARWRIDRWAVILLLIVGVGLRLVTSSGFSDVLVVTEAAIREMLAGLDPYGHGYPESVPPGAPFAYGPLALLWYLPSLDDPGVMETLAALVILVLLAVRGQALGLAVYAVTPAFVVVVTDGANDTTAGLLILLALLAAVRWPIGGAALLALAAAFKPYALAWLPGLVGYAGALAPLLAFVAATVLIWLVPVLAWGADALLWSFRRADEIHAQPYYSLAYALGNPESVPRAAWQALRVGAGVLVGVLSLLLVKSVAGLVIAGCLVFVATLFLGWWGTFAYFAAVAPVICWYLDEWLGLAGQRVVWPGDPVRSVTTWADSRWPIRHPGESVMHPSLPSR